MIASILRNLVHPQPRIRESDADAIANDFTVAVRAFEYHQWGWLDADGWRRYVDEPRKGAFERWCTDRGILNVSGIRAFSGRAPAFSRRRWWQRLFFARD